MSRFALTSIGGCCILVIALVLGWTPLQEGLRAWRIKQCKPLGHGVSLQVDELYRHSDTAFNVGKNPLFVRCRYLGGRPLDYINASLLVSPDGAKLDYGNAVECASPFKGEGSPTLWMFSKAPEHCKQFTMRFTINPGRADEHQVDFILPNQLKPYP